ncbi:MAG: hypothetical protein IJ702_09805 [Fretibacterium sp.]|nr:hypothetical protein [Fretibacterium sp.]
MNTEEAGSAAQSQLITHAQGGLFPKGSEKEVFVVTLVDDYEPNGDELDRSGHADPCLWFFQREGDSLVSKGTLGIPSHRMDENDYFPTYRIAVGDLNGDGAADEMALVYGGDNDEDIDTYFFECWQVSQSGSSLTASRLGSRVASHSYYAHRGSACDIIAGDFDSDGKLELAAAYGDELGGDSKKFTYIAIETFKWNGSDWTHRWDDTNDLAYQISRGDKDDEYRQGGIVMTAANLDGDGRDEIVTLALHGHQDDNKDERAQAFLAVWTCDSGNQPGKKGFWNLSDSSGAIKGLLDSWWTGAPWTWSWNLRLFSIAAGPFTGTLRPNGLACDDIAFSLSGGIPGRSLENVRIRVWLDTTQDGDETESRSQIANRAIPAIFPNTERTFKFLVDPERIQRARELKRDGKLYIVLTADNADAVMLSETGSGDDSSSSGCDTGAAGLGGLAVLALARALELLRTA